MIFYKESKSKKKLLCFFSGGRGGGGAGVRFFFTKNPNLKKDFFWRGWAGVSELFLLRIQI